ncbi:MAG: cadherin-like beta sandwich domain-containing protein [Nitrospira sp.]|nr:cadherin-like beta sandwich domain-containing protein [Nitrospira sp.]MDH5337165.1 cadherin-like beta sandwich domain-containing protein [Nitrospira sp.]
MMGRPFTIAVQYLASFFILMMGLNLYGCSDSASVSNEAQVPLASLTITPPGVLQPAFSSNTTSYAAEVPKTVASVTVTASPQDITATMTINEVSTVAGQGRSIPLGPPGSPVTITITVSSQTGSESTYTVTITRLLSSDNNLSALTVTPGILAPTFTSGTLNYTVDVATGVTSVTVAATKADPDAVISGDMPNDGQATIQLSGPGTTTQVTITVTAPNGNSKTYRVTVDRAASSNNNLSALSVTPGTLAPAFAPNQLSYTVDVATGVTSVTVTATKADPNAVISGDVPNDGQATIQLSGPGTTTQVTITVTAPNGNSKTYRVTIDRAASSNNNLSALSVTPGTLAPAFAPNQLPYTVDVATGVSSLTITATVQDSNASLMINGQGISSGQPREISPLAPPGSDTLITILVRAPSGAEKTYTVTVKRPLPSSDATLSVLTVSAGTLNPGFAAGTLNYTVNVPASVDSMTVAATKSDPNAVMSSPGSVIAPAGVATGSVSSALGLGATTLFTITVIAQDGVSTRPYTINVFRDAR